MNFNFGDVLTRAWQIIWKHKVLWIFGILAGCGRGGSGNFNSNMGSGGGDGSGFGQTPDLPPQALQWFQTIEENLTAIVIALCVFILLVWVVTIFLGTIGKIGLIRGTFQAEGGADALVFGELFSGSLPYFWRMFGLSLILGLPVFIIAMAMAIVLVGGLVASGGNESGMLAVFGFLSILIGCFCLLIPVMFVVGMIFRQAENAIVLEEMGVIPSLTRGWEIFKTNLGPIILMAIILGVIGLIVGFVIAIPFFIIVFPAMLAFFVSEAQSATPLILMGVGICLYIPVAWILQGIVIAYTESAWTLTYLRLTGKPEAGNPPTPEPIVPVEPENGNQTMIAARVNA